jgi:hypothetical protein
MRYVSRPGLERRRTRLWWTFVPPLRRTIEDPHGVGRVQAGRFSGADLIEATFREAERLRALPPSVLDFYVHFEEPNSAWPALIYRRTGLSTDLVARAETQALGRTLTDLLNRSSRSADADSHTAGAFPGRFEIVGSVKHVSVERVL